MYEYNLLIPKERVAVLIGEDGKIKRLIEKKTQTRIYINNEEVTIQSDDSLNAWLCEQVIKAIGRGFKPSDAIKIIKEDYAFEIINIMDYARNENDKFRLRSRLIGTGGLTRKNLEEQTGCEVIVYGKTVGIIGPNDKIQNAIEAVIMILQGAEITTINKFLYKKSKENIKKELI